MNDKTTDATANEKLQAVLPPVDNDAAARGDDLVKGDGAMKPVFLDDEGPSADIPPFISTTNARKLFGIRPGETVAEAAARKAAEG